MNAPGASIYETEDGWTVELWPAEPKGRVAVMISGPHGHYAARVGLQSESGALLWAAQAIADERAGKPWP